MGSNCKNMPYWITTNNTGKDEWKYFRKGFSISQQVKFAEIFFISQSVCGVHLNGKFVESCTGRYPQRVNRHEITNRLHQGENVIALELGSLYFQKFAREEYERRGFWFSEVALVLHIKFSNDEDMYIITDESWKCSCENVKGYKETGFYEKDWNKCDIIRKVRDEEYYRFWENAALWRETVKNEAFSPGHPIYEVVGEGYIRNTEALLPDTIKPQSVVAYDEGGGAIQGLDLLVGGNAPAIAKNFTELDASETFIDGNGFAKIIPRNSKSRPYLILDFGKLVVGYLSVEFRSAGHGFMKCEFDYSEDVGDFESGTEFSEIMEKLFIEVPIKEGMQEWFNIRRRAFRYLKISFHGLSEEVVLGSISLKSSVYNL